MLQGDAIQRGITAWHAGWEPAVETSQGNAWLPLILAHQLDDDYSAVRYIAHRSLAKNLELGDLDYHFMQQKPALAAAKQQVIQRWTRRALPPHTPNERLLINSDGSPQGAEIQRLLSQQDKSPVRLDE